MKQGKHFEKRRKRKNKFEDPLLGRGAPDETGRRSQPKIPPAHASSGGDFKAAWLVIACTMAIGAGLLTGGIILIVRGQHHNITDFLVLGSCGVVTGLCFIVVALVRIVKSIRIAPTMIGDHGHGKTMSPKQNLSVRAAKIKLLNEQKLEGRKIKLKNEQALYGDQQQLLKNSNQRKSANQFPSKIVHFSDFPNILHNKEVMLTKITHKTNEFVPLVELSTTQNSSQETSLLGNSLGTLCNGDNNAKSKNNIIKASTNITTTSALIDDRNTETILVCQQPKSQLVPKAGHLVPRHKSELKIVLNNNKEHQTRHGIKAIKSTDPVAGHTLSCFNKEAGDNDKVVPASSRHLITTVADITPLNPGHALTIVDMATSSSGYMLNTDYLTPFNPDHKRITMDKTPLNSGHMLATEYITPPNLGRRLTPEFLTTPNSGHRHTPEFLINPNSGHRLMRPEYLTPSCSGHTITDVAEILPPTDDLSLPDLPLDQNNFYHLCDSGKSSIDSSSIFQSFDEDDVKEATIFFNYFPVSRDQPVHALNGKVGHKNSNSSRNFSISDSSTYENSQQTIKKQIWSKRGSGSAISKHLIGKYGFYPMDDQIEVLGE